MSALSILRDALYGNPPSQDYKPSRDGVLKAFEILQTSVEGFTLGVETYATAAELPTSPTPTGGTMARVYDDPTPTNNTYWVYRDGAWSIDTDLIASVATIVQPLVDQIEDAADAVATITYGVRSPFQPDASFEGVNESQMKNFIIDADLSDWMGYNPDRFYSFAELIKNNSVVQLTLYEQTAPGAYVFPAKLIFKATLADGYDPNSKDVMVIRAGKIGRVAIVPAALTNTDGTSGVHYAIAGLDQHVFHKGYGLIAKTAGFDPALVDPVSHVIGGGYISEYAYLHPNEPAEHAGDASFPNLPGVGQWHRFTVGAAIQKIGTAIYNSAGQTFKGKLRVVKFDDDITLNPAPEAGTLIRDFAFDPGFYPNDFVLTLDSPLFCEAGTSVAVYAIPDDGYGINMRYWDHPRADEANPNGRRGLIYRSGPGGPWALGSTTADYAYWGVPLRLWSNVITRSELDDLIVDQTAPLPRLVLPSKVHAIVGREFNLYYDAMALLPDVGNGEPLYLFDVICDIGVNYKRSYRVTPGVADVGNHVLTVIVYDNNGKVLQTKSTTLVVKAAQGPGSQKRILCIGDSTTDDTGVVTQTLQSNLAALPGTTPLFIGTHGQAPYNMEARSGQTFGYYAYGGGLRFKFTVTNFPANTPFWPFWIMRRADGSGAILGYEESTIGDGTSGTFVGVVGDWGTPGPFPDGWTGQLKLGNATFNVTATQALPLYSIFKTNGTGALSFANYMSRFGFAGCDLLTIDLGINDSRGPLQSEDDHLYKINAAKAVIASALAYNANMKIMVCLTKSGASTRNGPASGTNHDSYRMNIHRLRELLIEHFDNGTFHANVSICASGLMIDRYYGYPLLDAVPVAARYIETETVHGDFVHPRSQGYYQVADSMTAAVINLLT